VREKASAALSSCDFTTCVCMCVRERERERKRETGGVCIKEKETERDEAATISRLLTIIGLFCRI